MHSNTICGFHWISFRYKIIDSDWRVHFDTIAMVALWHRWLYLAQMVVFGKFSLILDSLTNLPCLDALSRLYRSQSTNLVWQDLKKSMSIKPEREENIKLGCLHFSYLLHSRLRNPLTGRLYFTKFMSLKLQDCTFSVHGAAATGAHKCAQERWDSGTPLQCEGNQNCVSKIMSAFLDQRCFNCYQ